MTISPDCSKIVYLNGKFVAKEEAKVSAFDRGFLFGDGVYEVIPVFAGKPVLLREHLLRLQHSLNAIHINNVVDLDELENVLLGLIRRNDWGARDCTMYLQVTRGESLERDFYFAGNSQPTIFVALKAFTIPTLAELQKGKAAITLEDTRWKYCHIKSTSLLPSVLLYEQVRNAKCDEGILVRDGFAIEGISSNLFVVKNGLVITPPLSEDNLSGTTREFILQIFKENNINFAEEKIAVKDLEGFDEIWVSGSTRGIFPIVKLNGKLIGDGNCGPVWKLVIKHYLGRIHAKH